MRILFFAQLKDITGCNEVEWAVPDLDGHGLWRRLVTTYPELAPLRGHVRLARNWEYVDLDTRFHDTDEVALIPPVSGG